MSYQPYTDTSLDNQSKYKYNLETKRFEAINVKNDQLIIQDLVQFQVQNQHSKQNNSFLQRIILFIKKVFYD